MLSEIIRRSCACSFASLESSIRSGCGISQVVQNRPCVEFGLKAGDAQIDDDKKILTSGIDSNEDTAQNDDDRKSGIQTSTRRRLVQFMFKYLVDMMLKSCWMMSFKCLEDFVSNSQRTLNLWRGILDMLRRASAKMLVNL